MPPLGRAPFFIDLAMPLLFALAAIRMLVYGMRQLFAAQAWLKTAGARDRVLDLGARRSCTSSACCPRSRSELDEIVLPIGQSTISLLTLGRASVVVILTLIVTLWLSGLIEQRLLQRDVARHQHQGGAGQVRARGAAGRRRPVALQAIGFDLTLLTVFGGALGVGIGLGLQKLAANYIAGFTILLDQSIRLGDLITVDSRYGVVVARDVALRRRAAAWTASRRSCRTRRWSRRRCSTTRTRRREVRIGITVQSRTTATSTRAALMEEAARAEPRVLTAPERRRPAFLAQLRRQRHQPRAGLLGARPGKRPAHSEKRAQPPHLLRLFRANGIAIPYPRRDVRLIRRALARRAPPAA